MDASVGCAGDGAPRTTTASCCSSLVVGLESFGVPLPGETALIAAGDPRPAAATSASLVVIAVAAAAAIAGDNVGYWAGRQGRPAAARAAAARAPPHAAAAAAGGALLRAPRREDRLHRRFFSILRVTAAWLAGISHMPWWRFLAWNAAGGIVWARARRARRRSTPAVRPPTRSPTTARSAASRSWPRSPLGPARLPLLAAPRARGLTPGRVTRGGLEQGSRWAPSSSSRAAIERRDPYTLGHSTRVTALAQASPRGSAAAATSSRRSSWAARCTTSASSRSRTRCC